MKSYRKELWFHINRRRDFVNIAGTLQNCVEESGIKKGCFCVMPCILQPVCL